MGNKDFNRELDTYIKTRRKKNTIPSYYTTVDVEEETPEEKSQPLNDEYDLEEPEIRKGFFERMFGFLSVDKEMAEQQEEIVEEVDLQAEYREDIKQLGKITFSALNMLPERKLKLFKESEHYLLLRDVLIKHNLIKPPKEE